MTDALPPARRHTDDPEELDRVVRRRGVRSGLPVRHPARDDAGFLALERLSDHAWAHRHPGEEHGRPPPAVPSVTDARRIAEVAALKVDFERRLAKREAQP